MRKTLVAGLVCVGMLGIGVPPASAQEDYCSVKVVAASDLGPWNSAECSSPATRIKLPDGRVADLPDPGWTVTSSAATAEGSPEVSDVTISRSLKGTVAVIIDETDRRSAEVYGDVSTAELSQADAIVTPYSTNPKCDNYSYNAGFAPKWIGTFPWYRKSGISIPYTAVAGGINAMAVGTGTCTNLSNGATASYKGTTTKSATIYSNGLCKPTQLTNVIDTGTLPSGTLAATCTYKNASEISYASVRFNTAVYSWYTGTSVTGCSGSKYDAQGVMTHEAGHVFGLGHVANSTYQVMKTSSGHCETSQRKLGSGDLAGMKHLYP